LGGRHKSVDGNIPLNEAARDKWDMLRANLWQGEQNAVPAEQLNRVRFDEKASQTKSLDIDKVVDDLEFALDYQINRTAMEKISQALQNTSKEQFNEIVKQLEQKDRKFQGLDLELDGWNNASKRWDAIRLHNTNEDLTTYMIVQKGDTARTIAEVETRVNRHRTDKDIDDYVKALEYKNRGTDLNRLNAGQIIVLPFPA
jgi:hypothetical protein